jgi:hypothetical protein
MNRQPPGLVERAMHRRRRRQPCQRLDQPAGEASNESTKVRRGRVGWRWEAGQRWALRARRRRRSKPERGPAGRDSKEGEGVVDKKKGTTEGIEEQRALYTLAKRRGRVARSGGAKPEPTAHRQPDYLKNNLCQGL